MQSVMDRIFGLAQIIDEADRLNQVTLMIDALTIKIFTTAMQVPQQQQAALGRITAPELAAKYRGKREIYT